MMNTNSIFLAGIGAARICAAGIIAACLALPASAEDQMGDDAHTGSATVKLQYVYAVRQNGTSDPAHDAACKKQLSDINSKFVGMPVKTSYSIDARTLTMSAESLFPSPHATQPLELTANLKGLGIKGVYSFGAFKPNVLPEGYAVLFSISEKFTEPKSTFVVYGPKDQPYNCVISSAKAPFKTAESARFGMDQSGSSDVRNEGEQRSLSTSREPAQAEGYCTINGETGSCKVSAFIGSEKGDDGERYTCKKFLDATYVGSCTDGFIDGVAAISRKQINHNGPDSFIGHFKRGVPSFPLADFYHDGADGLIGYTLPKQSGGCVYFHHYDATTEKDECRQLSLMFGTEIFSYDTVTRLRNGNLNIELFSDNYDQYLSGE